ncbi:putative ubiquinone biosynthesis methyltransferase mitochondrial precursor [Dipodascopsis tothii]|uniref:putative ubiquinone biosynthesis methyltransferase mitochondrial precursor n=1 Tax=Dipodascopsis tothii TaxID=44089 RepID=UPI0034CF27E8
MATKLSMNGLGRLSSRTMAGGARRLGAMPTLGRMMSASAVVGDAPKTTHFGFRDVPEDQKEHLVREVFSSVASSYDVMNDVMSLGVHRLWKDHFVSQLDPGRRPGGAPLQILDVAGGTGDIAFRMLDWAASVHNDHQSRVLVVDINPEMLAEGEKRCRSLGKHRIGNWVGDAAGAAFDDDSSRIAFKVQNAEVLDAVPDNSQDLYTVAFGIRNFTNIPAALKTAHRVLKKGGVFACLEFSQVNTPVLSTLYREYSFNILPIMGQLVANDRDSYQYLVESIAKFPPQEKFAGMIRDAGFALAGKGYEDLTFGIAAIHIGVKV